MAATSPRQAVPVSLILEALRKLEKETKAPERGFLVVAASAWPTTRRKAAPITAVVALLVVAAATTAGWLWPRWGRRNVIGGEAPGPAAPVTPPAARPASTLAATVLPTATSREPRRLEKPAATLRPSPLPRASVPPRAAPQPSPPALVLQAISQRDGRPIAIVSDHLVREGDGFDGVTIVRIGEGEVEVEWQGQRRTLRF